MAEGADVVRKGGEGQRVRAFVGHGAHQRYSFVPASFAIESSIGWGPM